MIVLFILASLAQTVQADPRFFRFKPISPTVIRESQVSDRFHRDDEFVQKVDHFSTTDQRTFRQRFFIDSSYAKSPADRAPVLFLICGESTCGGANSSEMVNQLAKKIGAHRVALEHRYYGYSQPFKTLESDHLIYLSMAQAIEDLAAFQKFAMMNLNLRGKWVAVGGSYPGEVSAFYRMKHPELVAGALASSAPVIAKDKFEEYDLHVAQVSGPSCLNAIQTAYRDIELRLTSAASARAVKRLFNAELINNDVDFLYVVADMAAVAIQYGFQNTFCDQLQDGMSKGKVVEAYAKAGIDLFGRFGISPVQASFQGAESVDPEDYLGWAGMRSWMYQSCTEFGYYQVAYSDRAMAARSSRISLSYHHNVCNRLFGISRPVDVRKTNAQYYQQLFNSNVRNIYFTNGANDPWSLLSITSANPDASTNPGLRFFTIADASHCEDLGSRMSVYLDQARNLFVQNLGQWLSE